MRRQEGLQSGSCSLPGPSQGRLAASWGGSEAGYRNGQDGARDQVWGFTRGRFSAPGHLGGAPVGPRVQGRVGVLGGAGPGLTGSRFQASAKPAVLPWQKERTPSAAMGRAPAQAAASSGPPKAPLEEACQKLWRNLKTLPQTGKKVQQQLKSHLATAASPSLQDPGRSQATRGSAAGAAWDANVYTDPFVAASPANPSRPQARRDRGNASRKASRSVSWSEVIPKSRGWHQAIVRALSSQASRSEPRGLAEPPEDWVPEEYLPPPPFAPGYC